MTSRTLSCLFVLLLWTVMCEAQSATPPSNAADQNSAAQPVSTNGTQTDDAGRPVKLDASAPPPVAPPVRQDLHHNVKDVYFDFNRYDLTTDDRATLQKNAEWLKAHPDAVITIEGDADERGSVVYNLYLSDERALAARNELVKLGVPEGQILFATGWGKIYPVCEQHDDSCWSQNRRSHFAAWPPEGPASLPERAGATASGGSE